MPLIAALALPPALPNLALAQEEGADDAEVSAEAQKTEASEPEAGKERLSDRIKSVQHKVFLKRKRFEVFPAFGLDLNDPFFQHFTLGVAGGFHLADSMSLELHGSWVMGSVKQDAIKFVRQETDSLIDNPPQFKANADINFTWAPFYGKISLLGEGILHFDTYLSVGPGIFATDAGVNPAMNVGLGQRYFINEWLVARVELRDYLFIDTRDGQSDLQNLLMLSVGVSFFFPMSFQYEYQ
ncbi:MAG: outer membrane beta-barrel domain-containing protein [Deltaproteobacteria bacterium]|nr:outer membrane beta-barrel domain-containing protein [Deltaproteobacteria bacterium]